METRFGASFMVSGLPCCSLRYVSLITTTWERNREWRFQSSQSGNNWLLLSQHIFICLSTHKPSRISCTDVNRTPANLSDWKCIKQKQYWTVVGYCIKISNKKEYFEYPLHWGLYSWFHMSIICLVYPFSYGLCAFFRRKVFTVLWIFLVGQLWFVENVFTGKV